MENQTPKTLLSINILNRNCEICCDGDKKIEE